MKNPFDGLDDIPVSDSEEKEMEWIHGITMVLLKVFLDQTKKVSFVDEQNEDAMLAYLRGATQGILNSTPQRLDENFQMMKQAMEDAGEQVTVEQLSKFFPEMYGGN